MFPRPAGRAGATRKVGGSSDGPVSLTVRQGIPTGEHGTSAAGIGGSSPLQCRRGQGDRFGIGYAYTATSTEFGAIPRFLFDPRDAQNIEAYYRYQVTPAIEVSPAIEVTPDVQWVYGMLGGLTDGDGALVAGIRLNMKR